MITAKHIDSFVMFLAGAYFTYLGFRANANARQRHAGLFRLCGPCVMICGLLLLIMSSPPPQPTLWYTRLADGGIAAAEFPGETQCDMSAREIEGHSVDQIAYKWRSLDGEVSLIMSASPLVDGNRPEEERIEWAKGLVQAQGLVFSNKEDVVCGDVRGHSLQFRDPALGALLAMRLVFTSNRCYRAIAVMAAGKQTPESTRFLDSFRIRSGGANRPPMPKSSG